MSVHDKSKTHEHVLSRPPRSDPTHSTQAATNSLSMPSIKGGSNHSSASLGYQNGTSLVDGQPKGLELMQQKASTVESFDGYRFNPSPFSEASAHEHDSGYGSRSAISNTARVGSNEPSSILPSENQENSMDTNNSPETSGLGSIKCPYLGCSKVTRNSWEYKYVVTH